MAWNIPSPIEFSDTVKHKKGRSVSVVSVCACVVCLCIFAHSGGFWWRILAKAANSAFQGLKFPVGLDRAWSRGWEPGGERIKKGQ